MEFSAIHSTTLANILAKIFIRFIFFINIWVMTFSTFEGLLIHRRYNNIALQFIQLISPMQKQAKQHQNPKGYLLVHNISKKNNIGNIVRSACAFGIHSIFFVTNRGADSKKMKSLKNQFPMFGNQGTFKHMNFQGFSSLKEVKEHLVKNNIKLCGIQIGEGSKPIQQHPFSGDTCFFLGNEGTGMLPVHKQLCDYFVYIPQYTDKTASLNVSVAAGIIFHHFGLWAKYPESKLFGQKYQDQSQKIEQKLEQQIMKESQQTQIENKIQQNYQKQQKQQKQQE